MGGGRRAAYDKWDDRVDGGVLCVRAAQKACEHCDDAKSIQCATLDDDEDDWPERPRTRTLQRFSRVKDSPCDRACLTVHVHSSDRGNKTPQGNAITRTEHVGAHRKGKVRGNPRRCHVENVSSQARMHDELEGNRANRCQGELINSIIITRLLGIAPE